MSVPPTNQLITGRLGVAQYEFSSVRQAKFHQLVSLSVWAGLADVQSKSFSGQFVEHQLGD